MAFAFTSTAGAQTDYRCLNLCVTSGKSTYSCMDSCSGDPTQKAIAAQNLPVPAIDSRQLTQPISPLSSNRGPGEALNHRILSSLQPIGNNEVISSQKPVSPYIETKDYVCMTQCLQTKMQYNTCEKGCTNVTLKDGTIIVKAKPLVQSNQTAVSANNPNGQVQVKPY
jgi:hypothetical protein